MNALSMRRAAWIVCGDTVHHAGVRVSSNLPFNLNKLTAGQSVGVYISEVAALHIVVDGVDQGPIASLAATQHWHAVVDLYGKCVQVSVAAGRMASELMTVPTHCVEEKVSRETETEKNCENTPRNRSCKYKYLIPTI